ncbi:MAG: enoyl-CoA hydratase/isomerase family protein [Promethearchaeota archaeon]
MAKESDWDLETVKILKDTENYITTVLMNRPPLNLINPQLLDDLGEAVDLLVDDPNTRVIILRGSANCFSAGFDIGTSSTEVTPWQVKKRAIKGQRIFKRFRDIPKPVIAAIERYAFGGGLELAMNCDLRFAKINTKMGLTEVTLGLIPGWGGTQLMVRHLGVGKTMELILTGERIDAKKAFEMGLINRAINDDDFEEEVLNIAKKIALECSSVAVGITKQMVNFGGQIPLDIGLEMESFGSGLNYSTGDWKEGGMAFKQKRKPEFKGK